MNFEELAQYFELVVMVACLVVGYMIKTTFSKVPNSYIPTILAVLGALINVFRSGLTIENIVYGALMGLASTGMHQAFTRFVEGKKEEKENTDLPR